MVFFFFFFFLFRLAITFFYTGIFFFTFFSFIQTIIECCEFFTFFECCELHHFCEEKISKRWKCMKNLNLKSRVKWTNATEWENGMDENVCVCVWCYCSLIIIVILIIIIISQLESMREHSDTWKQTNLPRIVDMPCRRWSWFIGFDVIIGSLGRSRTTSITTIWVRWTGAHDQRIGA